MSGRQECNPKGEIEVTVDWSERLGEPDRALIETAKAVIRATFTRKGITCGRVDLFFVDDEEMRELNREYRGIDSTTDVLSFPMDAAGVVAGEMPARDLPLPPELGEIIISLPRAREQAETYGHSLAREIGFLAVHSCLHLCGFDHKTPEEEEIMRSQEEEVLGALGLTRD
ncbi:MAG: rRNA maturation RNase YbeY [Limnochordales bacterium]|nr:rRNA maturation RNase YbeY [Limnochordales bacterium]